MWGVVRGKLHACQLPAQLSIAMSSSEVKGADVNYN